MIYFDEGVVLSGRVTWGMKVGFICEIKRDTYRVRWIDGFETEQLRPDSDEEVEWMEAAE